MKKKKDIKFYFIKTEEQIGLGVEWDETQHCEICEEEGSYWVNGQISLCKTCVVGLAKFMTKNT